MFKVKMLSCSKYLYLMGINFYSKKILKFLSISTIISFLLCDIQIINKQLKAEKNIKKQLLKNLRNFFE